MVDLFEKYKNCSIFEGQEERWRQLEQEHRKKRRPYILRKRIKSRRKRKRLYEE